MVLKTLNLKKTLSKAYLKQSIKRADIELLKDSLRKLYNRFDNTESEEHLKNLISDFLKETWYHGQFEINTKGRIDLVIHNGKSSKYPVGVIIEIKKPQSPERMSEVCLNCKALHELILYYFDERSGNENIEIKHLVTTNINEWFIFDENEFDKFFYRNPRFQKLYKSKNEQSKDNPFFYSEAQKIIAELEDVIVCKYFNIKDFKKVVSSADDNDDIGLIELHKIFSPEHLLKLPFLNDSNSLNKQFYNELLHIIGLEETKEGSRKLISRKKPETRDDGSFLENTINILRIESCLDHIPNPEQFGDTEEERLFSVGLELCINWLNRILFLKLLEGQLITYHRGNKDFSFLNASIIKDFDELNELFFEVLAVKTNERTKSVNKKFGNIPFLNSSLFERSELETHTIRINSLKDRLELPVYKSTVIKDNHGSRITGAKTILHYLFAFLDAYDFASESTAKIQEQNKNIINASVLGLIFEKINGYKDGSFFTPGFITMYMCRETLRRAMVQKFNETYDWKIQEFDELKEKIDFTNKAIRQKANSIINSIKVCDPAVGSGHFLVSALNEIIAIKSELCVLQYRDGSRIRGNRLTIENDEVIIIDEETDQIFEYTLNHNSKPITELQNLQEAIFHEKQTIIENCLFGVDINPKSVMICRLRLWIELLKNAYYTKESNYTELETLPNIDINIKCGNSLISRFALDSDLKQALKKSKWNIDAYRIAVQTYRNASSKTEKHEMKKLIESIKNDFESEISRNDKRFLRLVKLKGELTSLTTQTSLFEKNKKEQDEWTKQVNNLTSEIQKLESDLEEIKCNTIYRNALEWRFEFPEVLNLDGEYLGFDVVIGNPPYIRQEDIKNQKSYLRDNYKTFSGTADLYVFFVEKGFEILKHAGHFSYIMPNKWMQAVYGKPLRSLLLNNQLQSVIDFGNLQVFDEATTYPCILNASKDNLISNFKSVVIKTLQFDNGFEQHITSVGVEMNTSDLTDETWLISSGADQTLLSKVKSISISLSEYVGGNSFRGVLTGLTEAFLINNETKERLVLEDESSLDLLKPFLLGRNIKPYSSSKADNWLILIPKGFTIKKNLPSDNQHFVGEPPPRYGNMAYDDAWDWFSKNYPAIARHLLPFKNQAMKRTDKGDFWWELRACDYYQEFEKPKIMYQVLQVKPCFIYDNNGQYCNNSMWIIPKDDRFLVGILNSKMGWWLISKYCTAIQNGYQLIWDYFGKIPIAQANYEQQIKIAEKVEQILTLKKSNPQTEVSNLETQIDQLIYQLYGLNEDEIKIVEGNR